MAQISAAGHHCFEMRGMLHAQGAVGIMGCTGSFLTCWQAATVDSRPLKHKHGGSLSSVCESYNMSRGCVQQWVEKSRFWTSSESAVMKTMQGRGLIAWHCCTACLTQHAAAL